MKLVPNIGPATRLAYVLIGMGFVAVAFLAPFLTTPWSVIVGALGSVVIVEGAVGF